MCWIEREVILARWSPESTSCRVLHFLDTNHGVIRWKRKDLLNEACLSILHSCNRFFLIIMFVEHLHNLLLRVLYICAVVLQYYLWLVFNKLFLTSYLKFLSWCFWFLCLCAIAYQKIVQLQSVSHFDGFIWIYSDKHYNECSSFIVFYFFQCLEYMGKERENCL